MDEMSECMKARQAADAAAAARLPVPAFFC